MISSLLLAAILAQEPPAPVATPVPRVREELLVTAERGPEPREETPAAVSVLTQEEIERLPAENLGELIEFLPGFHAFFRESVGGAPPIVTARGFFGGGEAEYVQLRIDGVPVGDVESGLADWRRLRASDIERIEALRGPASSLYGDTALAGVIQVFTRKPEPGRAAAALSASGGSFGTVSADGSYRLGGQAVQSGISGNYHRTDGHRARSAEQSGALDVTLSGPAGPGEWSVRLSGSRTEREEPGALTREQLRADDTGSDPLFRFDRSDTDRGLAVASWRREDGVVPLRATLYGQLRDGSTLRTLLVAPGLGDRTLRAIDSTAFGGSLEADRGLLLFGRESRLRAGTDLARERLETRYRAVGEDGHAGSRTASASGRRDRVALFATQDVRLSRRVRVTAGVRWDRIADDFSDVAASRSHDAWSPRLGVNWMLGRSDAPLSLFVQASRAFKAPTLDQLFDPHPFSDFQGGTFTISNPSLVPQKAKTVEAGVSRQGARARWELTAYRTEVENEIDFDPSSFRYLNIGRSLHRGVEAAARLTLGALTPSLSYAWTRVEPLEGDNRGTQLKNIPEHLVRAGLAASLPAGFSAEAIWSWMGSRYLDDENLLPLGDASVVDLRLERGFGRLRARLDLFNLTDTSYTQIGFALSDFSGGQVAYFYPGSRLAARIGIDWRY